MQNVIKKNTRSPKNTAKLLQYADVHVFQHNISVDLTCLLRLADVTLILNRMVDGYSGQPKCSFEIYAKMSYQLCGSRWTSRILSVINIHSLFRAFSPDAAVSMSD